MIIGTPKEIKNHEYRVGLTPESARELVAHGHRVLVQTGAGEGIGAHDRFYVEAGAEIVDSAEEIFATCEMVVKVKEPQAVERAMLREGQILYTYLHLAPDPEQTRDLMKSGAVCIAYETVTSPHGGLPLLKPMSQVAGRMSIQAGATALEKAHGGRGRVGTFFEARAKTRFSNRANLAECVAEADLVIGAVLIPGAEAPKLVTRDMLKTMRPGSVLVDVAIDQGGCFETSHATTHADPTYVVDGIVHYAVANMPGAVARTSTYALNNVTLPHALRIADLGWKEALRRDMHLSQGLNVWNGKVTFEAVAEAVGTDYVPVEQALA